MSGGTQKTKTENKPWAGAEPAMSDAANQLMGSFMNNRQAIDAQPISPYTRQGIDSIAGQVSNPNSLLNNSLGLAQNTVNGTYLNANPYINQAYQGAADAATRAYSSAVDPSMRAYQQQMDQNLSQWQNAISPGIDAQFAAGGRLGSGLFANARNVGETNTAQQFANAQANQAQYLSDANDALARNLTNTAGQMYYNNYNDERARQNAAMSAAPGLSTLPGGILQQLGSIDQASSPDAQQFALAQQYVQSASALNGGLGTATSKTSGGGNPFLQGLGLVLGGVQTAGNLGMFGGGGVSSGIPAGYTF